MSYINNPLSGPHGLTFTPFHLLVLLFASLALVASQIDLPPEMRVIAGMWKRAMVLLVVGIVLHQIVSSQIGAYQANTLKQNEEIKLEHDVKARTKFRKQPNAWENVSSHPSQFMTTRDGKPRLFPFPLGKAGGSSLKGELWWEAGNSAHVGHFKQKETPEAREKLRLEMEDQDEERQKKAKKAMEEYDDTRKMWAKRLGNLKIVSGIIILGLFHRTAAVVSLAAWIYYVLATELVAMLKPNEEDDEEDHAVRRRYIPRNPGMAMTYLYEPTRTGGVEEALSIPVQAPSNRLMTSTDNRYAS